MKIRLSEIDNELFDKAKKYITENSIFNPFVISNFISEPKLFPIVIIEEVNDILFDETLAKGEQKNKLTYEIEIYTMDKTVENERIARQVIIDELKKLVNDFFENQYGFLRTASKPRPNIDLDVARHYLRYECVFDTVSKKIYRR